MASAEFFVVQDERYSGDRASTYGGRQLLVPVLLGLGIPAVAVAVLAPQLLANSTLVLGFYMVAIFVIAAVIFIRSIFNPGSIVEASFDRRSHTATFVRLGAFATTETTVNFSDIERVYLDSSYDDDGYRSYMPLVHLKNGDLLELPEGTTQGQINSIREIVGR